MNHRISSSSTCWSEGHLLGGSGGLVSRFIIQITKVTIWVIGIINIFTKSP